MDEIDQLPRSAFGFPGLLRDKLVAAVVAGEKASTTLTLVVLERFRVIRLLPPAHASTQC